MMYNSKHNEMKEEAIDAIIEALEDGFTDNFATVEEMNETLIANWNRKVHGNDTVYILGDMFFRTAVPEPILRS